MNISSFRVRYRRFGVILAAAAPLALNSCNRGYGCPTNFSINEALQLGVAMLDWWPL